jgi:hypothetical protein
MTADIYTLCSPHHFRLPTNPLEREWTPYPPRDEMPLKRNQTTIFHP